MRQVKYALTCCCGAQFIAEETEDHAYFTPHIDRQLEVWKSEHQACRGDMKLLLKKRLQMLEGGK